MPPSPSDRVDPDPLLEFLSELEAAESVVQPVEITEDPPVAAALVAPADPVDPLRERVEKLEQALEDANKEVTALRSQVATLVRVTRDIDKRVDRVAAAPRSVAITNPRALRYRAVTATVALVFGIALAASLWSYATANRNPIVMHAVAASPEASVDPPAAAKTVDVPQAESPKVAAPPNTLAKDEPQPGPQRTGYVGTLSIDASPEGQVLVNGRDAGRTPLRLDNLKAGAHLIWIEREGYRRWTKVVDVPAGKVSRVVADLEPIASR